MANIYAIRIDRCFGVKNSRSMALRRCIIETPSLWNEFSKSYDCTASTEEIRERFRNFIRDKGLRILDEKPVVRIVDDKYRVDVYFKVTW